MNIKSTITSIALALSSSLTAGGLYIVSGGDFRQCNFKYYITTTNENQTVEISPSYVSLLSVWGNAPYAGPWSIKTDGQEIDCGKSVIRYENKEIGWGLANGTTNIAPVTYTYSTPGTRLVKIYETKGNFYQLKFTNNNDITHMYINWENVPSGKTYANSLNVEINSCKGLKVLHWTMPRGNKLMQTFKNLSSLDEFVIGHPETYTEIPGSFNTNSTMTNGFEFVNVTNVAGYAWMSSKNIDYLYIPKAVKIGASVLARWDGGNCGLKKIRIGDCLQSIGDSAFIGNKLFKTIEFVT
jgi:hypothetical protein